MQHREAAPAILGLSNGEMPSMFTNLVALPLGFWWRAPWGSSSYGTGGAYEASLRTIPRLRSEPHARKAETTPLTRNHISGAKS